ncbi:ABC transporter ATP-binding protein [Sulfitobacter sp. JL08]|uniref:ABC transporter ATP-binding protein n=1 Tax=Sulfitobacter sp. JL08 TaxID=2070369 RepID=UPI000E09ED1B|nr:ABC transporter ATP-binding protein [Sulfitobacter sp. JL08]AXI54341.1 ABC transporter ATP-binding protein [Sulfitobacter sp. JL08]
MIILDQVSKTYRVRGQQNVVLDRISAVFPSGMSIALLGANGAGKSTLLNILAGGLRPSTGQVRITGRVSYPIGFSGAFHPDLSGAQNARFVARLYGADTQDLIAFVDDFSELGAHLHLPVSTYSAGMKARLSFAIAMGIPFDTYLMDEVTAVGDGAFRKKSIAVFEARRASAGAIVVSHSTPMIRQICTCGAVLDQGRLSFHNDIETALNHHEAVLARGVAA